MTDQRHDPKGGDVVYRHRVATRIWHWINALSIFVMLMSGLMIFNAHPRLYWGKFGANPDRAWLEIGSTAHAGYLTVGDLRVETTAYHLAEADQALRDLATDQVSGAAVLLTDHGGANTSG